MTARASRAPELRVEPFSEARAQRYAQTVADVAAAPGLYRKRYRVKRPG